MQFQALINISSLLKVTLFVIVMSNNLPHFNQSFVVIYRMTWHHRPPWESPYGSATGWMSSSLDGESSCRGDAGHLEAAESSASLLHLKICQQLHSCCVMSKKTCVTWKERLLHSFHQTLQIMFYVVHHNVDLVHVAPDNYFLFEEGVKITVQTPQKQ